VGTLQFVFVSRTLAVALTYALPAFAFDILSAGSRIVCRSTTRAQAFLVSGIGIGRQHRSGSGANRTLQFIIAQH
jgi:hypothetical protein